MPKITQYKSLLAIGDKGMWRDDEIFGLLPTQTIDL